MSGHYLSTECSACSTAVWRLFDEAFDSFSYGLSSNTTWADRAAKLARYVLYCTVVNSTIFERLEFWLRTISKLDHRS